MAHDSGLSGPAVAGTKPKAVMIEAGRDYHWCACHWCACHWCACGHRHLSEFNGNDITTWKRDMAELSGISFAGVDSRR
jgi:hypothetical protein